MIMFAAIDIFLHVKNAVETNHREISIQTVDTDVVVIAVSLFRQLNIEKLWIEFGTGRKSDGFLYILMRQSWEKMFTVDCVFGTH